MEAKTLRKIPWVLSVFYPLYVLVMEYIFCQCSSRSFYTSHVGEELGPALMRVIIAALPFITLGVFSYSKLKNPSSQNVNGILVATLSVLFTSIALWGCIFCDAFTRRGGGANIGLGILLFLSPLYLPFFMLLGFFLGKRYACPAMNNGVS